MYKYTCKFMGECTRKRPVARLSLICRSTPPTPNATSDAHAQNRHPGCRVNTSSTRCCSAPRPTSISSRCARTPPPPCPNALPSCTKHSCGQCTGRGSRAGEKNRKTKEEEKNSRNLVSWLQCWGLHLKEHHTHKKRFPTHSLTSKINVKSDPAPAILDGDSGA